MVAAVVSDIAVPALSHGLAALLPLLRRLSNAELLAALPASGPARALLSLPQLPGRDPAHFLLNFLRHLDARGCSHREIAARTSRHLLRPVLASEQARPAALARHGLALRSLILTQTVACNLRCEHCYNLYEIHHEGRERLHLEAMRKVVAEARELGAYRLSIIGGEPLLRHADLVDLAHGFPDVLITIFTNGLLLTPAMAREIAALGNVELAFSIDGPEPLHDRWRGPGTFARTLDAMRSFSSAGGMALFAPTATTENVEALLGDPFLDRMQQAGAYMGYLHHYDLIGGQKRADWLLPPAQLAWMRERIEQIHRQRPLAILSNVVSDLLRGGCPAVRDFVHINHRGEVEPCCMVPFADASATIHQRPLAEILRSPFFDRLRAVEPDAGGIKRCLSGENHVTLRRAVDAGEARGATRASGSLLGHPEHSRMPTCFSSGL